MAAVVKLGSYNRRTTVYGRSAASCDYYGSQVVSVALYAGNTIVTSRTFGHSNTRTIATNTSSSVYARCGVRYQVVVVHNFNNYRQTTHWSNPYYYYC